MDKERIQALASTAQQGKDALEDGDVEQAYSCLSSLSETLELLSLEANA